MTFDKELAAELPGEPNKRRKFSLSDDAYRRLSYASFVAGVYISEVLEELVLRAFDPAPDDYVPLGRSALRRNRTAIRVNKKMRDGEPPQRYDPQLQRDLEGEV